MRGYVLTDRERKIFEAYLNKDLKLDGFSVVSLRLRRASSTILRDVELVKKTLEKLKNEEKASLTTRY